VAHGICTRPKKLSISYLTPWGCMSINHQAPGGTNSPKYSLAPGGRMLYRRDAMPRVFTLVLPVFSPKGFNGLLPIFSIYFGTNSLIFNLLKVI